MSEAGATIIEKKRSVRYRLLAIAILPTLVILPLFLGFAVYRWNSRFDAMLVSKVNGDLTIAREYLGQLLEESQSSLEATAASQRFRIGLGAGTASGPQMTSLLGEVAARRGLDFLYLTTGDGRVIASSKPFVSATPRSDWPVIQKALRNRPGTSVDIFENKDLAAISPALAQRAALDLIPTKGAAQSNRTREDRGMVIMAAAPVELPNGRRAALVGGTLLNCNLAFIDTINSLVYNDESLPEKSRGTTTLFVDDVRVSTNVRLFEGQRALGTRVSQPVRDAVLGQGRTWLGSAYVVNDWYISAYEPILDSHGRRIGMLYVGFLERPFTAGKRETLFFMLLAFVVIAIATVPLFLRWAGNIFRPLERMAGTIDRVEGGDLAARTGDVDDRGEIGQVASHLDLLLDQLQDRDRQLRRWNDELNERVEERTASLVQANQRLEEASKQLVMSEKLATIGEISAGVAHEINNPLAVMQGNLDVMRDLLGNSADVAKAEFRLLDEQIHRMSEIVTKLLQFAKPSEYAGYMDQQTLPDIITDSLPLVDHLIRKAAIDVIREDSATRPVMMNRIELQQVLVNLVVNAIHAMPEGGRLTLRTFDSNLADGRTGASIEVADTGVGINPDALERIFAPFFTTKERQGTGLGLSISQMLVTRNDGELSVRSEVGKGSTFTLSLPEWS